MLCSTKGIHKWHKEITAWAKGATIQSKHTSIGSHWDTDKTPNWNARNYEFRIHPCSILEENSHYVIHTESGYSGVAMWNGNTFVGVDPDKGNYVSKIFSYSCCTYIGMAISLDKV